MYLITRNSQLHRKLLALVITRGRQPRIVNWQWGGICNCWVNFGSCPSIMTHGPLDHKVEIGNMAMVNLCLIIFYHLIVYMSHIWLDCLYISHIWWMPAWQNHDPYNWCALHYPPPLTRSPCPKFIISAERTLEEHRNHDEALQPFEVRANNSADKFSRGSLGKKVDFITILFVSTVCSTEKPFTMPKPSISMP